ncbi:hypothetical protein [Thermomonas sp.]|uniref:hypothetical protein n=1 Tax=Thermomonas sp. TaxID=1971895 RepID=UPI002608EE14|nr:hypothetical protein [Thermomonas sp.]MBL0227684.1 hypothetical protein [Thermomonas sp.]
MCALSTTLPVYGRFGATAACRSRAATGTTSRPARCVRTAGRVGTTRVDDISATFEIPDADILLSDVPFFEAGWNFSGSADVGVMWALSDAASLGLEVGARYHGDLDGDDSAIGGLALASINDTGSRTSFPISLRFQMKF